MNIELDEVVVQDVSDDALELAASDAQRGERNRAQGGAGTVRFTQIGC
jgi:hypothetical protein